MKMMKTLLVIRMRWITSIFIFILSFGTMTFEMESMVSKIIHNEFRYGFHSYQFYVKRNPQKAYELYEYAVDFARKYEKITRRKLWRTP